MRKASGTAGTRKTCQLGLFVTYSSLVPAPSQVLVDRELYLPQEWASDPERRREAGVPEAVAFATKPELAQRMLARLGAAGRPAGRGGGVPGARGGGAVRGRPRGGRQAPPLAPRRASDAGGVSPP